MYYVISTIRNESPFRRTTIRSLFHDRSLSYVPIVRQIRRFGYRLYPVFGVISKIAFLRFRRAQSQHIFRAFLEIAEYDTKGRSSIQKQLVNRVSAQSLTLTT